jgi:hypothetical protein
MTAIRALRGMTAKQNLETKPRSSHAVSCTVEKDPRRRGFDQGALSSKLGVLL